MATWARGKENNAYYIEQGRCPMCREHRPLEPGRKKCIECLEYMRLRVREWRERQKTAGVCYVCGLRTPAAGKTICDKCREKQKERVQAWKAKQI